jgi:hypothetical protein
MGGVANLLVHGYRIASDMVSRIKCIVSAALSFQFVLSVVSSAKSTGFQQTVIGRVPSLTWTKLMPGFRVLFGGSCFGC